MSRLTERYPIPKFLKKHGIKTVSDNVPPGCEPRAPARTFMVLFGSEVMEAFTKKTQPEILDKSITPQSDEIEPDEG